MAALNDMQPRLSISVEESSPIADDSMCLVRQQSDNDYYLPPLPSVEQMRMDVANATCELQQAFFQNQKHNSDLGLDRHKGSDNTLEELKRNQLEKMDDPKQRTQEETVCEELIINGKKYRQTFQKRVVLESQKTREIFILPASADGSRSIENSPFHENYSSTNFDRYNRAFEENGARLDLQVHNQEGDFSPMLVIAPHGESPGGPRSPSIGMYRSSESKVEHGGGQDSAPATLSREESDISCGTPLVVSHMYHFGQWNKTATILDPRLPTSLCVPDEFEGKDNSIFCVTPAEWHHSDITYGGEAAGAAGTTAKARIVACLQRFTQRSAQTGKELHRSTYVQHTKIARWRSTEKRGDTTSGPGAPTATAMASVEDQLPNKSEVPPSPENVLKTVSNVSDVWKRCTRSPLGRDDSNLVISPTSLRLCPYNRLQLLQSLCPAAAAAIMILGGQMPEMRSGNCSNQSPSHQTSAVTAEAWCPRVLMTTEGIENLLLFSMPDGLEIDSSSPKRNCLLRGGTLDGLLVYALQIFQKNTSDTYESLIPNIFMQLYPTFTVPMEVVNRLIQRYLAFVPIEPGGLGCAESNDKEFNSEAQWREALSILDFLLALLTRTERRLMDSKFETKIIRFSQLLKVDARIVEQKPSGQNVCVIDESEDENLVCIHADPSASKTFNLNPISTELNRISESLINLIPIRNIKRGILEQPTDSQSIIATELSPEDLNGCTCQRRLNRFLRYGVKEMAEQITAMEEVFFNDIKIYELINIKDLEKGNTPTLSRCVQHFNDLNSMVRCLIHMAKELGQPLSKSQPLNVEDDIIEDSAPVLNRSCPLCGLEMEPPVPSSPLKENQLKAAGNSTTHRRNSIKDYLCMSPMAQNPSMRVRKRNFQLEKTLFHLCDLAETLKGMNNFSSFLAVVLGLQSAPVQNITKKIKMRLNELSAYMLPPNFSAYRRDLEAAKMPCIPYLGLVFQQLIHLDSGNLLFLASTTEEGGSAHAHEDRGLIAGDEVDADKIVNFWRCWKHYLILGYFMKKTDKHRLDDNEKESYEIEPNTEIQSFLNSFKTYSSILKHSTKLPGTKSSSTTGNSSLRKQRSQSANFNTLP